MTLTDSERLPDRRAALVARHARGSRGAVVIAVSYSILGVLPMFLVSAQAVQLQRALGFGKAALGLAVSCCFVASAIAATPLGRLVHRIGPSAGLRLSAAFSLSALLWMAVVASRWWHVAFALALCGLANASAQVATNVALAGGVRAERQGVAFGAKQAAIPLAALVAGLAMPIVALLAGWRAAFAGAAVLAVCAVAFRPRATASAAERRHASMRPTPLLYLFAAAGLLAGAVGNALPTFTVDFAVARGIDEGAAGGILAAGAGAAVLARVLAGVVADRRRSPGLTELAVLMGAGVVCLVLLAASGDSRLLFVLAVVAGFAAAWGWPGLIYYSVVRTHPAAAGAATGFVLSWVYVGNVLGPTGVGFVAEHVSYSAAWAAAAAVLAVATAAALAARALERRRHAG